jgi:hypothetical protein
MFGEVKMSEGVEEAQILRLGPLDFAQDDTVVGECAGWASLELWFALCANDPTLATMKPSRRWGTQFVAG